MAVIAFVFLLVAIGAVILGTMMDHYVYLYSPLQMLVQKNTRRSGTFLIAGLSISATIALLFHPVNEPGAAYVIAAIFGGSALIYHLHIIDTRRYIFIDLTTGQINHEQIQ